MNGNSMSSKGASGSASAAPRLKRPEELRHERRLKFMRWIQFAVYLWAVRLGILAFGSSIGASLNIFFNFPSSVSNGSLRIQQLKEYQWTDKVNSEHVTVLEGHEPQLYRNVLVASDSVLRSRIHKMLPLKSMKLKISTLSDFVHYSDSQTWSSHFSREYEYISAENYLKMSSEVVDHYFPLDNLRVSGEVDNAKRSSEDDKPNVCKSPVDGNCKNNKEKFHIYGTLHNVLGSLIAIAPGLAQYISLESSVPQVMAWFSGPHVTAAMHYDHENNLLLQLSGTKKVVLISPEALPYLKPYSSYHPLWRQCSVWRFLKRGDLAIDYIKSAARSLQFTVDDKLKWKDYEERKAETNRRQVTPPAEPYSEIHVKPNYTHTYFGEIKVWEYELRPGDMIYIPAGFYHGVTAGHDSISINAWFNSAYSQLYEDLVRVPLPFSTDSGLDEKIANFFMSIKNLLQLLQIDLLQFQAAMLSRYTELDSQFSMDTSAILALKPCAGVSTAESDESVIHTAFKLNKVIASKRKDIGGALLILGLIDFIEEVMLMSLGKEYIVPELLSSVVRDCLVE